MKRFGGDTGVVGRIARLNSRNVEIIGVVQPAPFFPSRFDALLIEGEPPRIEWIRDAFGE